ncbi:Intradiol ring-cleavage dioxygenase [Desarmillaria tabescens]|uniref:Intradiol ring-cleavage dioxygenase n=1 Tax=Armillaria tabescens TaxID=1929756 RepID=A0AA39JFB5_ARMTA|nr:Intradiol ring-cleavage dioxygenase [Desarmillaria tabescens]KAK0440925.1 Intradiol ring-cleavage dioxygenase [Desarmillaria tabescens]
MVAHCGLRPMIGLHDKPDCRGRFTTGEDGTFAFRAVKPLAYPFNAGGPIEDLLNALNAIKYRPAHLHFKIVAPNFTELVTQLYLKGDKFLEIDTTFAVKQSLIVDPKLIADTSVTLARGFKEAKAHLELERDFVLVREQDLIKPEAKA